MKLPEQAVILAGGRGTRLGSLTDSLPKPMMAVGGRPFLWYLLENLRLSGIGRVVLCVGYLGERIAGYFGSGADMGLEITYVHESTPMGTGGALKLAAGAVGERFLVMNGDTLFDIDYRQLAGDDGADRFLASMALREVADSSGFGAVETQGGRVTGFFEKTRPGPGWVNGGTYLCERALLAEIPVEPCSLERDVFERLAARGLIRGVKSSGMFIDIGLPETLHQGQSLIPAWLESRYGRPAGRASVTGT